MLQVDEFFALLADLVILLMHLLLDGGDNLVEGALKRVLHVIPLEIFDVVNVGNYKIKEKIHGQQILDGEDCIMARKMAMLLTTCGVSVVLLVNEVTVGSGSSSIDLTRVELDSLDLLADVLKLAIDACRGLVQLHQDLKRANLELLSVDL